MVNLGIDFGSTYTTVSIFREDTRTLETLTLGEGIPYIPSVVSIDSKGETAFGLAAKKLSGKKGSVTFKAFKMLLTESDSRRLAERGFTGEYSPAGIAGIFIESVLSQILADLKETEINNLVIGVPEIWSEGLSTLDGRAVIRDICRGMDFVRQVKVVSEPAAASAFFAHNYYMITGKNYEGCLLLVDYGGGTLDITLTQITAGGGEGHSSVQIKVLERTGAGENEEGRVGKAGIVYMETVMERAIEESGLFDDEGVDYNGKFFRAVDELETDLQTGTKKIEDVFEEYGLDDPEELYDEEFTTIEYKGEDIEVSYGLLLDVYNEVIRDIYNEKLDEIIAYMDKAGIRYMDGGQDIFKIALVGGFGNFYLVKSQIKDKFKLGSNDRRQQDIIKNKADCEKAISLGTALLSAGVVGIRNTAAFSIGVWAYDIHKNVCLNYAIRYRQDIEFNKVYYARGSLDNEVFVIQAISGGIDRFLVNFGQDDRTACFALVKEEFAQKLSNVIKNQYRTAVVGFSVDQSGVLSIHVHDYDVLKGVIGKEDNVVELTKFSELFEAASFGNPLRKGGEKH